MINTNLYSRVTMLVLIFGTINFAQAQKTEILKTESELTYAKKLGTTKAIRDMAARPATPATKKNLAKEERYIPRNFESRFANKVVRPEIEHLGEDPIRQKYIEKKSAAIVSPSVNIDGLFAGGSPHDPTGDAGLNYYLQAVNATEIGVYEKDGTFVSSFTGNTLWGELGYISGGDPIILYDQEFNRWIITEFPFGFGNSANKLLVAISKDDDPLGEYDVYAFGTPRFPDYPKYSIWSEAYSVTTNEEGAGVLHAYFINRRQLLNGDSTVAIQRVNIPGNNNTEARFLVASPVDWTGENPPPQDRDPIILALNDASWNSNQTDDLVEIYSVSLDWEDAANTIFSKQSLAVTPYDSYPCAAAGVGFSCVPQLGGNGLDALPELIMNQSHYRNFGTHESMVLNFITDVTDGENLSGIRWMELRRTESEEWSIYQEGTFAPDDGLNRMLGGIAMDGKGNIGLAYNVSSDTTYVGIRFTGRRNSDPLGQMTIEEFNVIEGSNTINSGGRFADYVHMTVDPEDDETFWYTTEYAKGGTSYSRILAFRINQDSTDMGPFSFDAPLTGGITGLQDTLIVTVQNFGINAIDSFEIGYMVDGSAAVRETVLVHLESEESYTHQFAATVDMSLLGEYNFKVFTTLTGDESPKNDTLEMQVRRLAERDLSIKAETNLSGIVCGDAAEVGIQMTNQGIDTVTSAILTYFLNGEQIAIEEFDGTLAPNASIILNQEIEDLKNGTNILDVIVSMPNGMDDQIMNNDSISIIFDALLDAENITLNLLTDDFPDETTWELLDMDDTVIYSGGPYNLSQNQTLITESFCLDPESCYTFVIYDDFGDGFSAYGIDGNYTIVNEEGIILASVINVDFGDEEYNSFCVDFECMLDAEIDSAPDTGLADGMMIITASNGLAPFQYSIDGGMSFTSNNAFQNLPGGIYSVQVKDANACLFEAEYEVILCDGNLNFELQIPSDDIADGSISIILSSADSNTIYSIDGGMNYVNTSAFIGLAAGAYEIVVEASNGCQYNETVHLNSTTATNEFENSQWIRIFPNPTEAELIIEIEGVDLKDIFLKLSIFNQEGKIIQRKALTRYNEMYKGSLSMYHFDSGIYYIKFHHPEIKVLSKLYKN